MAHLESGPHVDSPEWDTERVIFSVWGYRHEQSWSIPSTLYQVSMMLRARGPRMQWAVGYFDTSDRDLVWYDYAPGFDFDGSMQMWEDEVAQLRDKPYTEPEE